jgi:RNA polymerase sigma factor (sigma-70 family)
MTDSNTPNLERLLRELTPQVLGALSRRYRDFGAAEDAVQEALLEAALHWPTDGLPENPGGWLYRTAFRRLTDHRRSDVARRRREEQVANDLANDLANEELLMSPNDEELDLEQDDTLMLLFMCSHPSLTATSAIALTLRAVGGLTTREIGAAFFVPEATMAQRISRAKQLIKQSNVPFSLPSVQERSQRLDAVMHVLYLIFNEGYASSCGTELQRVDLSGEAIRLARLLMVATADTPEVAGLLSLMLLTDARRAARSGPAGELIPLDEQDRGCWDRDLIREGNELVWNAMKQGRVGPYQLQAAVAALHDEAASTEETDWAQIHALYELLERMGNNPMVTLNRAVAAAMVQGPEAGLRLVDTIAQDPKLRGHYRVDAVRAHLYERAGNQILAIEHYQRAADQTASLPERNYLLSKIARLASR